MANDFPALPFEIGSTFGATSATDGAAWEGREFWVEDKDYSSTSASKVRAYGALGWRRLRVVRNLSGVALLPGLLVVPKATGYGKSVDGYSATTDAQSAYPVDEFLPAAGCPANDLCYIVVEGPAGIKVDAAATVSISQGSDVAAVTAAASTHSTTAGRVYGLAAIGTSTAYPASNVFNRVGRMLSSATTADAGLLKLCYVYPHR